ncbi:serine/threonine-protein kinase [Kitasatospora mediocidica]|uniref:serine/threonine-protein kinase n=1 Tax=Kitasatospora mediocidica TaxID=58352 RepID=UPI000564B6DA|nr:serine/threonine-protein kinase [Kitasatospora mediocidica]
MSASHQLPEKAGPYVLLSELGRGGMGRVLLGVSPDGRPAAVKLVHARHAADDGFRSRFRREVAASRKVSGAYTAAVLDADAEAEQPWLASVFVAGPSLGAAVERCGALPAAALHRLAVGLATALGEIHRAGLVHRDLKPENVLLAEDGARVIDFGIARAAEGADATELTGAGWVIGSPPFMSPEQAEGRELTAASDVFSLGSVLVLAATGRSPFSGPSALQTLYNVVHTQPDLGGLPPALYPVVARCLAKNPADRPTPAGLLALLGPVGPAARPWPDEVHRMVDERRAHAESLLNGSPERTLALRTTGSSEGTLALRIPGPPGPPTQLATAYDTPVPPPHLATAYDTPVPPPRGRRRAVTWAAAGAVLLATGIGVGAYLLRNQDSGPPDAYLTMPTCAQAAPALALRDQLRTDKTVELEQGDTAKTQCFWYGKDRAMADGWNSAASATVGWDLDRSTPGKNATRTMKQDFGDISKGEHRESGLGFGDEAFWWNYATDSANCQLSVRAGNLMVGVLLVRADYPDCETAARAVAKAALAAMPTTAG